MRALLLGVSLGLAACSAVPPEPVVPLAEGVGAFGVTLDVPVRGKRTGGLSVWGGVGVGRGVDVAASVDAPFTLIANLGRIGRDGGVFAPPGLLVRKTFEGGVGLGLGTASMPEMFVEGSGTGFYRMTAGPFVTVGTGGDAGPVVRTTAHLVYEIDSGRDSVASRRGWSAYGTVSAGLVRVDPATLVGVRAVGAIGFGRADEVGAAVGPFVTGVGEN